ncbi:molybdopterin-dependent oxidoreductase [Cytobacillus citreus]|uniref:molybdopterin-dependent oxidoreductase n=1 Tax=Cytobacillus citreus TaxID=2833586 RepID=UPI0020172F8A|nr:molybdopterin-dependent oxidoreductase [Cytobacillus citreus]
MASAVTGFMTTSNLMSQDLDEADVLVTWGANMAEMHPVLFSRLTARKLSNPSVKHFDLTTRFSRTSETVDSVLVFRQQTDLAIANAIANYLIQNNMYDQKFIDEHLKFKAGTENLGHSFKDDYDVTDGKMQIRFGTLPLKSLKKV